MADDGLWAKFSSLLPTQAPQSLWNGLDQTNEHVRFKTASPLVNITDEDIERGINIAKSIGPLSADLGGGATLGAGAVSAETSTAGATARILPRDNYLGPVSRHTDTLYREMHPSEALIDLPTSVSHGGNGPGGVAQKFYADQPDLALGQGANKGVKVEYDSAPFDGKINSNKPAWDMAYQNGNAEYVAYPRPGTDIRDSVKSFEVDPSSLSRVERSQYQRVISNLSDLGWDVKRTSDKIIVTKPK